MAETINRANTVEQLELLLELARDMGYEVRHEVLGGSGGGACEFAGRKCLFVDMSLNPIDQLEHVSRTLCGDPQLALYEMTEPQESALQNRKAA